MKKLLLFILLLLIILGGIYYRQYENDHKDENILTLYGNVDVRQVDLGFLINGRIDSLKFEEGDFVKAKTVMATIEEEPYKEQLTKAKSNYESIKASLKNAEYILTHRNNLIGTGSASREEQETALANRDVFVANLKEAEASIAIAQKNLDDTHLIAPSDGIVFTRIRELGSIVNPGESVYTLSLVSPVWIRAYVSEGSLGNIFMGMEAEIFTDTQDAPTYKGHIGFISPVAEFTPKTVETTELRSELVYRIRVYADNPDWRLKQGMPVTIKIDLSQEKPRER